MSGGRMGTVHALLTGVNACPADRAHRSKGLNDIEAVGRRAVLRGGAAPRRGLNDIEAAEELLLRRADRAAVVGDGRVLVPAAADAVATDAVKEIGASPVQPSGSTPRSTLTRSPSRSGRSRPGTPCTIASLTGTPTTAGNGVGANGGR